MAELQRPHHSPTQSKRSPNPSSLHGSATPSNIHLPGRTSSSSSQFSSGSTAIGSSSSSVNEIPSNPNQSYLKLCINTGEYTKSLSEIDLRDIGCDGDLFKKICSEYSRLRGFRSRLWLLKPSAVHFVRVIIFSIPSTSTS
jgi:hypothetical protein